MDIATDEPGISATPRDLVSVVIPAYNAAGYLAETIASVLGQTWSDLELIIVDDGSTDDTVAIASSTGDPRVTVVAGERGGAGVARNRGLALARGRTVCFLDADDVWYPEKLALQLPLLQGPVTLVGAPLRYVSPTGRHFGRTGEDPTTPVNRDRIRRADLLPFQLSAALMDRAAVVEAGGFDPLMVQAEDLDLYTRLAQTGEVTWVNRPLGAYRVHLASVSVNNVERQRRAARYLVERTAARRAGLPDPEPVDFTRESGADGASRTDAAAAAFRHGAVLLLSAEYLKAMTAFLTAARLDPMYLVRRATMRGRGLLSPGGRSRVAVGSDTAGATEILGVEISAVDEAMAVDAIAAAIDTRRGGYVCVTGVHGVMESQRDPSLRAIHNASLLTVPDGMPMVWLSQRAGAAWVRRVYGPDLMLAVLSRAAASGWSSFLYGGAPGVVDELSEALGRKIPGFLAAGTYSPPFRPLTESEEEDIALTIQASGAELVWVGLSTPKQERWMAAMAPRLPGVVLLGVGAAFDFHTDRVTQAPGWMQRRGLEWLFRLIVEPRRLWRRYLRNNPAFVAAVVRQKPHLISR